MIINTNPEFGIELTLVIPYAYYLHKQGKLDKVVTTKDMRPLYYFCDDVEEAYTSRTVNNEAAGLGDVPNDWIYGDKAGAELYKDIWHDWKSFMNDSKGCGILDYSEWEFPPYGTHYKKSLSHLTNGKPYIVITNRYNHEHGHPPTNYFTEEALKEMFTGLTERGYAVIYKRPKNTEFALDENEQITISDNSIPPLNDRMLPAQFPDVYLFDDLLDGALDTTYNEFQMDLFANAAGFVGMGGGGTLFASAFGKPTVGYWGLYMSEANRENFFENEDGIVNKYNYHFMINPKLKAVSDPEGHEQKTDYKIFNQIVFKEFTGDKNENS